jgi:HSP20 family protein
MTLVKFNEGNKGVMAPVFNDIFESFFNDSFFSDRMISRVPAVNISETENEYHIELTCCSRFFEQFKKLV